MGNTDFLNDLFSNYQNTSGYNGARLEIMLRKQEFEENLDLMWNIYSKGNVQQIVEYQKGVNSIKSAGLKVLRNSAGKHKIVSP